MRAVTIAVYAVLLLAAIVLTVLAHRRPGSMDGLGTVARELVFKDLIIPPFIRPRSDRGLALERAWEANTNIVGQPFARLAAGEKEGCTVAVKGSWDAPTSLLPQLGGRTRTAHKARRTPHHIQTQTHTDTGRHALRLAAWVPHLYACRSDAGTLGLVGQPWTPLDRRWASMFPGR